MHFVESWTNKHSQHLYCAIRQQWLNNRAWKNGISVSPIYNGCLLALNCISGQKHFSSKFYNFIIKRYRCAALIISVDIFAKIKITCIYETLLFTEWLIEIDHSCSLILYYAHNCTDNFVYIFQLLSYIDQLKPFCKYLSWLFHTPHILLQVAPRSAAVIPPTCFTP